MLSFFLLGIGLSILAYFLWDLIHETSHLLVAHFMVGVRKWSMKLWPHYDQGALRWGAVEYWPERAVSSKEEVCILLAPRIPNLLSVLAFPFSAALSGQEFIVWGVLWGAGLVDLLVGSLGISPTSDLRLASHYMKCSPWLLRVLGMILIFTSVGTMVTWKLFH